MSDPFHNILVHCLVNIGDVVLSTSALVLLRRAYPQAKVTMMVRSDVAEIMENHPMIDEVLVFDYKKTQRSFRKQLQFLQKLRRQKYDIVFSLDRKMRPALLTWLAGIPIRVAPNKVFDPKPSFVTHFYTHVIATPADFRHTHQAEIFQSIINGFTGRQDKASPVIGRILPQHEKKAASLMSRLTAGPVKIGLCVKGTYPLKNWPASKMVELIDALNAKYHASFFIVGASADKEYAEEIILSTAVSVQNFCGETSLMELAALLVKTDLFITIDTGAMHIGAAVGVPIIGFYRCVSVERWWPLTKDAVALANPLDGCPKEGPLEICPHHYCVGSIPLEKALEAVERIMVKITSSIEHEQRVNG